MPERPETPSQEDVLRKLRKELNRIGEVEVEISKALDSLQATRRRTERLLGQMGEEKERVRSLVREELWGAEGGTQVAATPGDPAESSSLADRIRGLSMAAAGTVLVAVVLVAAWLVFNEAQEEPDQLTVAADATPRGEVEPGDLQGEDETPATIAPTFFDGLPADPELRAQVYDSLWAARSPLFDPLIEEIQEASDTRSVQRALTAWESDGMTPLQEDYLHSAMVQLVLRDEVDGDLDIDGTLLRNPCRGESCSALLNLWEIGREDFGLAPMPDDAPRNRSALRTTEAVLVLREMRQAAEASGGATPAG